MRVHLLGLLIREKVIGLFIANSFMLTAFFLSMQGEATNVRFTLVRYILVGFALTLCCGFAVSLASDNRAKLKTAAGLEEIERTPPFDILKEIKSRPISDIEGEARYYTRHKKLKYLDLFWVALSVLFAVLWGLVILNLLGLYY